MMDSATSAEALGLATALLGENGDTFAPMVEAAANLDPYLASILEQMGLIEQMPDGTYQVTADTANAQSAIDQLIASNERLIQSQWTVMYGGDATAAEAAYEEATGYAVDWDGTETTADVKADAAQARGEIEDALDQMGGWDAASGTADANVNDNASATILNVSSLLSALDGRTSTSYIVTEYISNYSSNMSAVGHGGVAGYAVGGVVAEMAEWGPELLHFPNGGVALARDRGLYSVPQGTYVDTAPATAYKLGGVTSVNININGPSSWDDAAEQVSRKIVPAIQRAMREHERSLGAWS
jgi:hypothetical protein